MIRQHIILCSMLHLMRSQMNCRVVFFSDTFGKQSFTEHNKGLCFILPVGDSWKQPRDTMCTPASIKEMLCWKNGLFLKLNVYCDKSLLGSAPPVRVESPMLITVALSSAAVQYQLQKRSPWRVLCLQWKLWLVLIAAVLLMGLVSYVVHCLMVFIDNPPPPRAFKMASVIFGLLAEILLLKWVFPYYSLCTFGITRAQVNLM